MPINQRVLEDKMVCEAHTTRSVCWSGVGVYCNPYAFGSITTHTISAHIACTYHSPPPSLN